MASWILKFFLNVSKEEQKKRFLERIDQPEKNWKFSTADAKERAFWDDYQKAYEDCLNRTSTEWAPWFVVPANNKWFTQLTVSEIVVHPETEPYPNLRQELPRSAGRRGTRIQRLFALNGPAAGRTDPQPFARRLGGTTRTTCGRLPWTGRSSGRRSRASERRLMRWMSRLNTTK